MNIGDRVAAVCIDDQGCKIYLYGAGIYVGDEIPTDSPNPVAQFCVRSRFTNPKIQLDDGKIIYGCECCWDSELNVTNMVCRLTKAGYEVIHANIDKERQAIT